MSRPPGFTGSGPAPAITAELSVRLIEMEARGGPVVTCVFTRAEVLLSSFVSAMVSSGSTTAVLVMVPTVPGEVALMVMVALSPGSRLHPCR